MYYGWWMVVIGFVCYGLGLVPGYVSWGFYGPEVIEELSLSRTQLGIVFGTFAFIYSLAAPVSALSIHRFGLRVTMVSGLVLTTLGFGSLALAQSFFHCLLAYGVAGGIGVGLAVQLPVQTIASVWFERYRARALAIMLASGGLVGLAMPWINKEILEHSSWRLGWLMIGGLGAVATVAALFARTRPEDLGLRADGETMNAADPDAANTGAPGTTAANPAQPKTPHWTPRQAILSRQFALLTFAAVGSSAPWAAWAAHGRLHLENVGYSLALVASVLSVISFVNVWGRFSGLIADFLSPPRVMAASLLSMGLGFVGLVFAYLPWVGFASAAVFALGFSVSLLAIPVTVAYFFGAAAFAGTQGTSRAIIGIARFLSPTLTGLLADWSGGYTVPFLLLAFFSFNGAVIAFFCPHPGDPGRLPVSTAAAPKPAAAQNE